MSELIDIRDSRATIRWKLLTGASALALTAYVSSANIAKAGDSERPLLWVELGAQLSRQNDGQEVFAPDLFSLRPSIFSPSQKFEKPPLYAIDEYGKISFQPEDSNWVLSASIRYGRSASNRHVHQQTYPERFDKYLNGHSSPRYPIAAKFADTNARNSERHLILDFQAGKDMGLGMLGSRDGSSTVNLGIRFAQFSSKSNITLKSDPDWHFDYKYLNYPSYGFTNFKIIKGQPFHSNYAHLQAERSFHGVGPSLSWNASMPFAGDAQDGELALDWGVNAALLFGRQRAHVQHQATGSFHPGAFIYPPPPYVVYHDAPPESVRSRSVTVPNVGGFAGMSFRYADAKLSLGYRADFFFNAIDGGIDTRKNENRGFFGPFASISIGLGD